MSAILNSIDNYEIEREYPSADFFDHYLNYEDNWCKLCKA